MNCSACNHENRDGAKFCEECAAPLPRACASCGAELRPSAKFCDECGAPTAAAPTKSLPARPAEAPGARKVVTIIFGDLVGSTALHERLDPESVRAFMESYYAAMRGAVEAHGGRVTQVMGDGIKAVFGAPRVAEDDAIRAVRAAVEMQRAFHALADEQRDRVGKTGLRVAVNTGEVVTDDETEIIGDPVNVAARLQEQGRDGDVVIGGSTQRLVASLVTLDHLGSFALKGRSEQVEAYRVVSLDPPAVTKAAFVGRDEELARLGAVYDTAVSKPAAQLAVLLGSPGLGKSRLIDEFARRLGDSALVLMAHCDASGSATFAPLVAALRERLGLEDGASAEAVRAALEAVLPADDAERARIAGGVAALLAGSPASPEETFFVVRRLLAALTQQKPVVLVIDDLHWAESLLLDLVEHLVQWGSGVPLFVLVGARPELRELRSSLALPGGFVGDVLTLAGLDAGAAMRLAAGVIGAADLPAALAAKLLASSEGNPLFVRELVKMLVQEGVLHRDGERWVASAALADLEMPPTIHALLAARIERLRPEERAVLERAAVVGRHFSKSAVAALLSQTSDLDARLEALRRSELIERDTGWFLGEPVLRFHHVLIRDAAYRRILKGTRAELHARLASWIEARAGDAAEHDETIGWHLEQAHQHLAELGPLDAAGTALGERAAGRLAAAGRRALARDDVPVAGSLLGRALGCLPADAAERAELALDWCEALLSAGNVAAAGGAIAELARAGGDSPRLRAWHTCFVGQLTALTEPQSLNATVEAVATAAEALASLDDAAGEAKAHFVHAQALMRLGKVGACEAALDRALAAARRAGDRRRANAVLAGAPLAALWGPSPVTRASGRCLDVVRVLRITQGAPAVEAVALSCQGVLEALRGRTHAARRMLASSRKLVEELGIAHRLFEADGFAGRIEAMEGDAAAAERLLRGAYEGLRDLGLGIDAARAGALLARALLAQGRAAEAEALSHESEALAGDDLQASIAWRGVRAEALAQRGEYNDAIELAQAAVAIAAGTDALLDHADARMALAAALRAAGRAAEADAEERRAIELWEAKGATLLAERAQRKDAREPSATPVAAPSLVPSQRRRVLPNAATRNAALLDAAIAAHDADALLVLFADDMRISDHTTRIEFGRQGGLASWRSLIGATEPACHHEPLGTLGDSLGLFRLRLSASGFSGGRLDVGAYEKDEIHSVEADAQVRRRGGEVWATADLDEAVARLYERYAELLPEGPGRTRAAAVARSLGTMLLVPGELKAAFLAPDFASTAHRQLGTRSGQGATAFVDHLRALHEVADDVAIRTRDVLALGPNALLMLRMHSGTERIGGGGYERPFLVLFVTDAEGRLERGEWFDAERGAEALARFDALTGGGEAEPAPDPFENAAARADRALMRCFNTRDWDGVLALAAPGLLFDERRRMLHNSCGREIWLEQFRLMFDVPKSRFTSRLLATRGERLSLNLHRFEGEVAHGGGPLAMDDHFALHEVDPEGRIVAIVLFDEGDQDAAYAELDARFEAGEGTAHARTLAAWRRQECAWATRDWDALSATRSPGLVFRDHRLLGWGTPTSHGVSIDQINRSLVDLAPDVHRRHDHVRLGERGILEQMVQVGTRDGGVFENVFLAVYEWDAEGRCQTTDNYDVDRFDLARARFEELSRAAPASFANAASRAFERRLALFAARDWEGFAESLAPGFRNSDRRKLVLLELDREQYIEFTRSVGDLASTGHRVKLLATRGDRLALHWLQIDLEDRDVGPSAIESLVLVELDERGHDTGGARFDADDLDAAYAELDARYEAHAPAWMTGFCRAAARRDWHVIAELSASDLIAEDHRLVSWGTLRGPTEYLPSLRSMVDLAPDVRLRLDHLRAAGRAELFQATWFGTRDGGAFEIPVVGVIELDERRRQHRLDLYDLEKLDQARARFAEIAAAAPADARFANAATRSWREVIGTWQRRDLARFAALHPAAFRYRDRRRLFLLDLDREQFLDFTRPLLEMRTASAFTELLATRGERLALVRHCTEMAGGDVGASAIDSLLLAEIDGHGLPQQYLRFDLDDEAAARAELDARYAAGDAAAQPLAAAWLTGYLRAFAARDWTGMAALFAPDLVAENHRLVGWGTLSGPAALLSTLEAQVELAPDTRERVDHVRLGERGVLLEYAWCGTHEGGEFENLWIVGVELDALGRGQRAEVWEPEQQAKALAWFDEVAARSAPDAHPFANAASRAVARMAAVGRANGWQTLAPVLPDSFRFHDRRRLALLDLDREGYAEYVRSISESRSMQVDSELIATRGERLALERQRIRLAGGDVGPSELANLSVYEVDERGECVALVRFDDDELDAAYAELETRWRVGEAAGHAAASTWLRDFGAALVTRNWDAVAACYAPDFVGEDHRLVGWGTLRGPPAFVETLRALVALAPDVSTRTDHVRSSHRALLLDCTWVGTRDGGAFESPFIVVMELDAQGRAVRGDFYDPHHVERALARFAELAAAAPHDPLASLAKPNLATATIERMWAAWDALDLDAARELMAAGFVWEDRRPIVGLSGGLELMLASVRERVASGARMERRTIIGTAGDRVAMARVLWAGGPEGGRFEVEFLTVHEVDEAGLVTASIFFETGDARAAQREAWARWARIDPAVAPLIGALGAIIDASSTGDRARYRAQLADDLVVEDHRRTGMGRIDGPDAHLASVAAIGELVPSATAALGWHWPALAPHGALTAARLSGTLAASGGEFESIYLYLFTISRGRIARIELFELEQLDTALARFEELRGPGR